MKWWGSRVIKTAFAVVIAVWLAYLLKLDDPLSAGILAILGMDITVKRSVRTAAARFLASLTSLGLAAAIFALVGYHPWALGLFVLICYPLLVRIGLKDGIVTASVIVFHVYGHGEMNGLIFLNEALLLTIGLGTATLINMIYVPDAADELMQRRLKIEALLSTFFGGIADQLRNPQEAWEIPRVQLDGLEAAIEDGMTRAQHLRENHWWRDDEVWQTYFKMRDQQMLHLGQIAELADSLAQCVPQATLLAEVCAQLAEDVQREFYSGDSRRRLSELEQLFRKMALPASRAEFEARAALFELRRELHAFLDVAERSKKRRSTGQAPFRL